MQVGPAYEVVTSTIRVPRSGSKGIGPIIVVAVKGIPVTGVSELVVEQGNRFGDRIDPVPEAPFNVAGHLRTR